MRAGTETRAVAPLCLLRTRRPLTPRPGLWLRSAVLMVSSGLSSGVLALCWKVLSARGLLWSRQHKGLDSCRGFLTGVFMRAVPNHGRGQKPLVFFCPEYFDSNTSGLENLSVQALLSSCSVTGLLFYHTYQSNISALLRST